MPRRTDLSLCSLFVITAIATSCGDSTSPEQPGPPTGIKVSAGDKQTGSAANVLAAPLAAKVTDASGRGVPDIDVTFRPIDGSGTVSPTSARTNSTGVALTSWTLPNVAGTPATVRAVLVSPSTGALVDSVSFTATVVGGTPTRMAHVIPPSLAATGSTLPLTVLLSDAYGNSSPGVRVTWTVTAGGGALSAPSTVSDDNGIASASFTLGSTAGTNSVTASVGTLSATFMIEGRVAGRPDLIFTWYYPRYAGIGDVVSLPAIVRDGLYQPVAGATVAFSVLGGGGTLSSATSVTDAAGLATIQYTLGSDTVRNTVEARIGSLTTTFSIDVRIMTRHLASLSGAPYGIARTASERFVVSLIVGGAVVTFQQNAPDTKQTITTGGTPVIVAADNAGAFAYVSNMDGWLDIISLSSNSVVKQVTVPYAHALAISPAGDRVFVSSTDGYVYAVSTTSRAIINRVIVPNGPWGFAFKTNATDSLMYVTSREGVSVTEVDMKTLTVLRTFNVGGRPHGLAISPDGRTLYAADLFDGQVKAIDVASGTVAAFAAVYGAMGIAISPDGSTLYVTAGSNVVVLDAATMTVTKTLLTSGTPANGTPRQIVVAPDGATAYSANEGGWVDIIPR